MFYRYITRESTGEYQRSIPMSKSAAIQRVTELRAQRQIAYVARAL